MNIKSITLFSTLSLLSCLTFAEDWAISATASCRDALGNTISSGGGIKASGGTAVVVCPLTKEVGSNTINTVYARLKRASTAGASTFCYLFSKGLYGSPSGFTNTFASNTTNNQSLNVTLPTQYFSGYADLYCVLVEDDTLFGVRIIQDN